jgi:hypothetical protein
MVSWFGCVEEPTVALYQVSTRSTRRRRLGLALRKWLPSGRPGWVTVDPGVYAPTRRLPRYSLIPEHAAMTQPVRQARILSPVLPDPADQPANRRRVVYPNAYRG